MSITFGNYRILGNDLPPRHDVHQTLINTDFILNHEERFPGMSRVWCLNRIYDTTKLRGLKSLIEAAGDEWFELEFSPGEYQTLAKPKDRLRYLTNVNPARNACLAHGERMGFDVVMPSDGAAFFRRDGWVPFEEMVYTHPPETEAAYGLPLVRVGRFEDALNPALPPQIREEYHFNGGVSRLGLAEPYLGITALCDVKFNEELDYGQVDKVELLWKLGMHGPWDYWEPQIREQAWGKSKYAGSVKIQGWVVRLPTHEVGATDNNLKRGHARNLGKIQLVQRVDGSL